MHFLPPGLFNEALSHPPMHSLVDEQWSTDQRRKVVKLSLGIWDYFLLANHY